MQRHRAKFVISLILCAISLFGFADSNTDLLQLLADTKTSKKEKQEELIKLTDKIKDKNFYRSIFIADSLLSNLSSATESFANYIKLFKSYALKKSGKMNEGIELLKSINRNENDEDLNAAIDQHIARGYLSMSDYNNAIGYYLKNLKYFSTTKPEPKKLIETNLSISNCFRRMKDQKKALEYLMEALRIANSMPDNQKELDKCSGQLAIYYLDAKEFKKADSIYAGQYAKGNRDIALLNNYCEIKINLGEIDFAEKLIDDCYSKAEAERDTFWMAIALANKGSIYNKRNNYSKAIKYCDLAYEYAKLRKSIIWQKNTCGCLFENNLAAKNYKEALENYRELIDLRDSIINEKNHKEIARKEIQYEYDKKEAQAQVLAKAEQEKTELKAAEDKKRLSIIIWSVISGLLLVSIFSVFLFRSLQQNKNANKVINAQKTLVEAKQKEILDSIEYASRIQKALITSEKYIEKELNRLKKS